MRTQLLIILPLVAQVSSFSARPTSTAATQKRQNHNKQYYDKRRANDVSQLLLTLARAGKSKEAIELYYDAWKKSEVKNTKRPNTRTMNNAIAACARPYRPLYNDAFSIFHHGVVEKKLRPNVYTFGSLMSVCAKKGNVDKCQSLLKEMREVYSIRPNSVIYSTAISACERCSPPRSKLAIHLLREAAGVDEHGDIRSDGCDVNMDGFMNIVGYNAAISVCARAGEYKLACQLLNEMEGKHSATEADANSSNSILGHVIKPDSASSIFVPRPDEVTYGTAMAACERAKEWNKVLDLAKQMEEDRGDLVMDGMAISSALLACKQLVLGHEALEYLEKMKQLGSIDQRGNRNNRRKPALKGPDSVAYRLAISACARSGLTQEAIGLLDEMKEETGSPPDVVAYTVAIGGCAETGDYVQAIRLLKQMKENKIEPNVISYSAAISACATASANAMAASKKESKNNDDPFAVDYEDDVLTMAEIQRPMKAALILLDKMKTDKSVEPNIVTYNAAIRSCAEGLKLDMAFNLLDDLTERGLQPTIITYGTLMTACERVGNVDGVSKVFKTMRLNDFEPNEIIFGAAISCCRKASQPERTLILLRKMLEQTLSPNTATFNTVIMAQVEAKNMDKASAVFNLLTSNHARNARPNRQTYNILIKAMAANKRPSVAEYYLERMQEDGMKPDVGLFTATVTSYERNGEPRKALEMMEGMREDGYDFYEMKLLDAAFKQGVKVIHNVVGKTNGGWIGGENSTMGALSDEDLDMNY